MNVINIEVSKENWPLFLLRCCGDSSCSECRALFRRRRRTLARTWLRIGCCRSNRPTPSRFRKVHAGCNRKCTFRWLPPNTPVTLNASRRRSSVRIWTLSRGKLQFQKINILVNACIIYDHIYDYFLLFSFLLFWFWFNEFQWVWFEKLSYFQQHSVMKYCCIAYLFRKKCLRERKATHWVCWVPFGRGKKSD